VVLRIKFWFEVDYCFTIMPSDGFNRTTIIHATTSALGRCLIKSNDYTCLLYLKWFYKRGTIFSSQFAYVLCIEDTVIHALWIICYNQHWIHSCDCEMQKSNKSIILSLPNFSIRYNIFHTYLFIITSILLTGDILH
jgi:hypothetical protein